MGEVVVSSEYEMALQIQETEVPKEIEQPAEMKNQKKNKAEGGGNAAVAAAAADGTSTSAVRWERFLPKMAVRVLLVEDDDSTRQIIAALLRKCSYKVAAVPDGLKAWEVLKERSHNIDLILTEFELPSISGYALLTLIMEHDICKSIPVIMMSSHDTFSTVYKCMLRGAADFLVKPVRKNELRNLWQHVWRKQASRSADGLGPSDDGVAQQKIEATAENNAVSNHSSGYLECIQRNRECIEKGSDALSSCTKPESKTEGPDAEHACYLARPKAAKCHSDDNIHKQEECHQESRKPQAHDNVVGELQALRSMDANYGTTEGQGKNSTDGWGQVNVVVQTSEHNRVSENSPREAIDLIGAFDSNLKGTLGSPASNASTTTKFDILPLLDLSLKRSHASGSVNQVNDDKNGLNHSDSSAFSRYINKQLQPCNSTSPSTCNQQKDHETNSEKQLSNCTIDYNSDTRGPTITSTQPEPPETTFLYPHQRVISQQIPVRVRGVRFENVMAGLGSVMPQLCGAPSGLSPLPSPGTASHSLSFSELNPFCPSNHQLSSPQQFRDLNQTISNTTDQTDHKHGQKLENLEGHGQLSSANDQSADSSLYEVHASHHHGTGPGSNGKINSISKCGNAEGFHIQDSACRRSIERQAALTKFRLKRKDRCFEKKVRYESRKKLAELRPRVKGQFVRQVPI